MLSRLQSNGRGSVETAAGVVSAVIVGLMGGAFVAVICLLVIAGEWWFDFVDRWLGNRLYLGAAVLMLPYALVLGAAFMFAAAVSS